MTPRLSKNQKLKFIEWLVKELSDSRYGDKGEQIVSLLDTVFNLRLLDSEDPRFKNAYEDAVQHLVNNNDWDLEYVFLTRFDVIGLPDEKFKALLETLVSREIQRDELKRLDLVESLNGFLKVDGYSLNTESFDEDDRPVFGLSSVPDKEYPSGVLENRIQFHTVYDSKADASSHSGKANIFIINFSELDYWNDYSLKARSNLYYKNSDGTLELIGELKFLTDNDSNFSEHGQFENFSIILPSSFYELDDSFCSLGQTKSYYQNLQRILKSSFRTVLYALKDAAFFTDIADEFENKSYFKQSLIREDKAERILREMKYDIEGYDRSGLYRFIYNFNPPYTSDRIPVEINFQNQSAIPSRICAIIGKNGVGKTQFITQLPRRLGELDKDSFSPTIPLFSKIIALSYSPFDSFIPPKGNSRFEYIFCSIREQSGAIGDEKSGSVKFGLTRKRIETLGRVKEWRESLEEFLAPNLISQIFLEDDKINTSKLNSIRKELSSGQRILLESVSNVLAHIRFDSLLLFDEPETHLHPNAIAQLMNLIYSLVNRFESFCIITTHSPIIIRELLSRNVFVFDRIENMLAIRKIGIECFGANLSTITEEVFGTNEIPKHFQVIIRNLRRSGYTAEQIITEIESDGIPVGLGVNLYIQSLFRNQND